MAKQKRSQRMQLIVDLARRKEDDALKKLLSSQQILQQNQQRLMDIQNYYSEYHSEVSVTGQSFDPELFQRTRQFLAKLDSALDQQKQQIYIDQQRVDADTQAWRQLRLKTESLISYKKRCEQQEQREDDQREQKALDELSAQRFSAQSTTKL